MVESKKRSKVFKVVKSIFSTNPLINLIIILLIISISLFLIFQCFATNPLQLQSNQDNIIKLQQIDADFNQAILKSRYELFTSYDPLVRYLQQQKLLVAELAKTPDFLGSEGTEKIDKSLKEISTSLEQKIDLSDHFKSQNALLKNSLRYLPLLTNQLEVGLEQQTQNLTPAQLTELQGDLNKLIRNLLIFNVTVDDKIQAEIESLRNSLLKSQVEYGLTTRDFPVDLVVSHTNIILNMKPQVEDLTARLIIPINKKTEVLENLLKNAQEQANLKTNIYRVITAIWLLFLLALFNIILLRKSRSSNPQFSQYKNRIERVSKTLTEALAMKNNVSDINTLSNITDLASRRDILGNLANNVIEVGNIFQQEKTIALEEESLAFLTAKLTLVTQSNQKIFNSEMLLKLKVIFEMILDNHDCHLIDLQEATDRLQLLFRYPSSIRLSQFIRDTEITAFKYFQQEFPEKFQNITNNRQLWSKTHLIVSCDSNFLKNSPSKPQLTQKN